MIKQEISDTGDKVIYAMNENGELLRIALDEQQKALSATIVGQTTRLIEAINDQTATLEERFKALDKVIKSGLKKVYLSIDANTGAIQTMDENINGNLVKIDGTLTSGFKSLKKTITAQGTAIVGAINDQGELLVAEIKSSGEVISAQIKGSINKLIKNMNANNTALVDKIDALNTTVQSGLGDIQASIDDVSGKIVLQTKAIKKLDKDLDSQMSELNTALTTLNGTISSGFAAIKRTLGGDGTTTVIEAINKNGDILKASIGEDGSLTSAVANVNTTLGELLTAVKALDAKIKDLNDTQTGAATELKEIKNALNSLLAKDGIYVGTDQNIYMTPSAWQKVSADESSSLYKSVMNAAKKVTPSVSYNTSRYYTSSINRGNGGVVAVNKGTYTASGTSEQVYKIVNVAFKTMDVTLTANRYWTVRYSFTDAEKYKSNSSYLQEQNFTVVFVAGDKLVESVDITVNVR